MTRKIKIKNLEIPYTLRRSRRAKHLRLTVNDKGELSATLPFFLRISTLERFIKAKSAWIIRKTNEVKRQPLGLLKRGNRKQYLKHKEKARVLAHEKLDHFNSHYRFKFNRISIRNQRTRWGSCSSKKNLNFNWRVIYLPQNCTDYLIVHELCHLREMNHSKKFWKLVEETIPDYKTLRKKMLNL